MEILLTGNTSFLTREWLEEAFPNDHVLVTGSKGVPLSDLRIKTVALESKKLLGQLDTTYQFDRIVYFSEYLIPHSQREGGAGSVAPGVAAVPGAAGGADLFFRTRKRPDPHYQQVAAGQSRRGALPALRKHRQGPGQGVPVPLPL
jgi:hypothetical protein